MKIGNNSFRKTLSLLLSLCLVLGMAPMTAFAEGGVADSGAPPLGASGEPATPTDVVIAAFDALPEETLFQSYDLGEVTDQSDLDLPGTLTGTDEDGGAVTIDGVIWQSEPAFDRSESAVYEFATVLPEGYALAEGVAAPVITVTVGEIAAAARGAAALTSGTVTGKMDINGTTVASDLGSDAGNLATNGWAWDAESATLTLSGNPDGPIYFNTTDSVNLVLTANVTIADTTLGYAIKSNGNLIIDAGSFTLTMGSSHNGTPGFNNTIRTDGDLTITGGTVNAERSGNSGFAIIAVGSVTIENGAVVTALFTGANGAGIFASSGSILITGSSEVTAKGNGGTNANALRGVGITISGSANVIASSADGGTFAIFVPGGDLTVSGNANLNSAPIDNSDIYVTDSISIDTTGMVTAKFEGDYATITASGGTSIQSGTVGITGDVSGDLTVSDGTVNVGDIDGNVTVSGGIVTTGKISGATTHTGGTLNGKTLAFFDTVAVTFNLALLPAADANGGSSATAWSWDSADSKLTLSGAGPYPLAGTASGNMQVSAGQAVDLTLNGAEFTSDASYTALYLNQGGTVRVTADSKVTGGISTGVASLEIVLDDATLQAHETGIFPSINAWGLTLSGSGTVTATSSGGAVLCAGDLTVGTGCTLSASGTRGIDMQSGLSGASPTICGAGQIIATGGSYYGIASNLLTDSLTFDFTGNLAITGTTYGIDMQKNAATTVIFSRALGSLTINSGSGIIGASNGGSVTLQNTASIPGLTEAFNAGGKIFPAAAPTYLLTVRVGTGGTITTGAGGGSLKQGDSFSVAASANGNYTFSGWTSSNGGSFANATSAATTFTMPGKATTITANFTYTGGGGGSGNGGGSDSTDSKPSTPPTSENVSTDGSVSQSIITKEAASALGTATGSTATVRTQNAQSITPAALKALADAAVEAGKKVVLHADTMQGNAVQGRIYVQPEVLLNAKEPIKLGIYTKPEKTAATTSLFGKYFDNKVATVSFEQQGGFGAQLEVAAKVDLTGMDVTKLVLYSYDKSTNTYRCIEKPAYWIDKNGYMHFTTELAGDIIISNGPLALK